MEPREVFSRLYDLAKTYDDLAKTRSAEEGVMFRAMKGAIVDAIVELSDLTDHDVDWMLRELGYYDP